MANRPPRKPVDEVAERRAQKALDRIAERVRSGSVDAGRLGAFVEEGRQAEEVPGPVSIAVREAIAGSGLGVREIARRAGISHGQLSRFMRRERSLSLEAVDKLAPVLKLKVSAPKPKPGATE